MEKDDKGSTMIRMGVSGWMILLVPAYPGCPGSKAVKRSLLLLLLSSVTNAKALESVNFLCVTLWLWPFDLEQLSYMASHVTNLATKYEDPAPIHSWVTSYNVSHWLPVFRQWTRWSFSFQLGTVSAVFDNNQNAFSYCRQLSRGLCASCVTWAVEL